MVQNHISAKGKAIASQMLADDLLALCRTRSFDLEIVEATYVVTVRGPGTKIRVVAGTAKECLAALENQE